MGHTVLLTQDDDDVSVTTGYGDKTCEAYPTDDYDSTPTVKLGNKDFMRKCDGSFFVKCEEDNFWTSPGLIETSNDYPAHNIQMYIGLLEHAAEDGFEPGRGLNKKCSQDWQCDGSLLCDEDTLTCKQHGSYDYLNCPDGTACLKSLTYRGETSSYIDVEYVLTHYNPLSATVPIRIVDPEVRNGVDVLQCIEATVNENLEIDIMFDIFEVKNKAPGTRSYVALQFGYGSCNNFEMISNENIEYNPTRPTFGTIDLFVAAPTNSVYCGQICLPIDFMNPLAYGTCMQNCIQKFI